MNKSLKNHRVTLCEAARIVGVPIKTLGTWIERGIVTLSEEASGKGTRRQFSAEQLLIGRAVSYFRGMGVGMEGIKPFTDVIHDLAATGALDRITGRPLLVRRLNGEVVVVDERDQWPALPDERAVVLVYPLWFHLAGIRQALLARKMSPEAAADRVLSGVAAEEVATQTPEEIEAARHAAYQQALLEEDTHECDRGADPDDEAAGEPEGSRGSHRLLGKKNSGAAEDRRPTRKAVREALAG